MIMNYKPVFLFFLLFVSSVLFAQNGPSAQNETQELRVTLFRNFHFGNVTVQGAQAQIIIVVDRNGVATRQTLGNLIILDQDFYPAELYLECEGEGTIVVTNIIAPSNIPMIGTGKDAGAGEIILSNITFHLEPPFEVSKSRPLTLYLGGTATLKSSGNFFGNSYSSSMQISFIYENAEPL